MSRFQLVYLSFLMVLVGTVGCATHETKREAASTSTAADNYPSLVVNFGKGSSEVTNESKREINRFIDKARADVGINEVYVAAWADQARVGDQSLSDAQQELARKRARNISNYMEDQLKLDVDTFNMAKRTNVFGRVFNTEEARIKGEKPTGQDRIAWRIHNEGKPSSAVLVVEPDRSDLAD